MRVLVLLMLLACGAKPAPTRIDFDVGESPRSLVVANGTLVWTDSAGAIWSMATSGGTPKQLSEQHRDGFMFHPVVAGGRVFVSTKRDVVRVDGDRVTKLGLALPEDPEEVVGDEQGIYVTLFKRDDVMAIPLGGGAATKRFAFKRGVLAVHASNIYAVSYTTGVLVAAPTSGGAPRTIAKGFVRPTALAVDDTHAFVYSEKERTITRVELATGATNVLARDLENSDDIVSDGAWLYTYSWPRTVLRIAKDSGATEVLADDLKSPTHIAIDADAIYVVSRDQNKIVRLLKKP
jgi:outer membrane protein assembly factor BamB